MASLKEYNRYGEDLEKILLLQSSPLAVKMLEKEADIPQEAVRPKKDRGYHLAQCQTFAMSRRDKTTVAMLKEDNWCPAPVIAYGLVDRPDYPGSAQHMQYESFERDKYIGILTAPLKTATYVPDVVLIYSDTNQLRSMLLAMKDEDRQYVKSHFFPPSCAFAVVNPMLDGNYWINLPDPGEYARALTAPGEMMLSVPAARMAGFMADLRKFNDESSFAHEQMYMRPDFPHPDLYRRIFKSWGMDTDE
jgi:uncharacterized protein (DUF169 family)